MEDNLNPSTRKHLHSAGAFFAQKGGRNEHHGHDQHQDGGVGRDLRYYNFLTGYKRCHNLIGVTNPSVACELIRQDGWATSLKYSANLKALIAKHSLTEYDRKALGGKDIDAVARDVIDGKYGNGEERKARLRAAGYDYEAVQKKVNELVK